MEDLLVLILFMYPGAFVEFVSKYVLRESLKSDDANETVHGVKYFCLSCVITMIALFLFAAICDKSVASFGDIKKSLDGTVNLVIYVLISLAVSVFIALATWGWKTAVTNVKSRMAKEKESAKISRNDDAWKEIFDGKDYEHIREGMIMRITSQGVSKAGFVKKYFDRFDCGIVLTQTSAVEEYLEFEEKGEDGEPIRDPEALWIGRPQYTFFEPNTGTFIEIFDGKLLVDLFEPKEKEEKAVSQEKSN